MSVLLQLPANMMTFGIQKGQNMKRDLALGGGGAARGLEGTCPTQSIY